MNVLKTNTIITGKVILWALIVILPCFSISAVEVDNVNTVAVGKFIFRIGSGPDAGEAWLVGVKHGVSLEGEIAIPGSATFGGTKYKVSRIGDDVGTPWYLYESAIHDWPLITRVTIPSTIRTIHFMEFLGCTGITEFHVNSANLRFKDVNGLLYYRQGESDAWAWHFFRMPPATKKTWFTLPDDVETVWDCAFADNKTIKTLIFQGNVMLSPGWAFRNKGIREFDVSKSRCYSVRDGLLYEGWEESDDSDYSTLVACPPALSVGSLTIPPSVTEICSGAFESTIIPEIIIPPTVRKIGSFAFHDSKIKELKFHHNNKGGDWTALCAGCKELETVEITGDVFSIKIFEGQFLGCDKLKNLTIESSDIQLAGRAFYGCKALKTFPFERCSVIEGSDGPDHYLRNVEHFAFSGIVKAVIPSFCEGIPQGMFKGSELTEISLNSDGSKLKYIYGDAFRDCNLNELILPDLVRIDPGSFEGTPLQKVVFPKFPGSNRLEISDVFSSSTETWYYVANNQVRWDSQPAEGVYITGLYPTGVLNVPRELSTLYCPGRLAQFYAPEVNGRVVEMFSVIPVSGKNGFLIKQTPEAALLDLEVNKVLIGGVTSLQDGDSWCIPSGLDATRKEVTVSYAVDGVDMLTSYPAGTFSLSDVGVIGDHSGSPRVTGIYSIDGTRLSVGIHDAPAGVWIIRYSDGTAGRLIKNE